MTDYFDIVDDAIDSLKAQVAILYYDLRKNVAKFDSINVIGNMNTLKQRILQLSIDAFSAMATKLHAGFIKTKEDRDRIFQEQRHNAHHCHFFTAHIDRNAAAHNLRIHIQPHAMLNRLANL